MSRRVLVADDDWKAVELLKLHLEQDGYQVITAYDGKEALEAARTVRPDLLLLDIMMPELDGLDVCRLVRAESKVPIILLTARATQSDRVAGLDLGADDYVTKPFSPEELMARVRAVLRRAGDQEPEQEVQSLRLGSLVVDFRRHEARVGSEPLTLTPTEFKLLKAMASERGSAVTRARLLELVVGNSYEGFDRTIDVHILNLRRKIEPDPAHPRYLVTVYGVGYRLDGDDLDP